MNDKYDPHLIIEHKKCGSVIAIKISELLLLLQSGLNDHEKIILCPVCKLKILLQGDIEKFRDLVNRFQKKDCAFWIDDLENL